MPHGFQGYAVVLDEAGAALDWAASFLRSLLTASPTQHQE